MKRRPRLSERPDALRRAAERRLGREKGVPADGSPEGVVHELRVHQIELEMQNEELRRAQAALEESRDRYADLYDFAPVGYLTLTPGDLVAEANLTAAGLLGVERPKLLLRRLRDFVAPEDADRWDRHCATLRLLGAPRSCSLLLVRPDGQAFPAQVDGARTPGLEPAVLRVAVSDLSERARLEAEKRAIENELLRSQHMASIGVLAGGLAHDFNNAFATIQLNLDVLRPRLEADERGLQRLEGAGVALAHAAERTRQLLEYAGRALRRVQDLDLNEIVASNAPLLGALASGRLRLHLGSGLPRLAADPTQVYHVLIGLVRNAAEAIGTAPGLVRVSTGTEDAPLERPQDSFVDEAPAPGRYVWLEVADDGCGMDEKTRRHAAEPFFSTKFAGRGLGLAAILGVVRLHGGALSIESAPGRGTTVRALFPAGPLAPGPGEAGRASVR